jgi:hypothetical protein
VKPSYYPFYYAMFRRLFGREKTTEEAPGNNRYGIDENSKYCPQCGDEYRAEIETCSACSIPLISGSEKLANLKQQEPDSASDFTEISAADELVSIQAGKLGYLKPLQHLLRAAYIPSILAGDNNSKG